MKQGNIYTALFCFLLFAFVSVTAQTGVLKSENMTGKKMFYDYGSFAVDIIISSDTTLYWKMRDTGKESNEKTVTIHLDDYTTLTSWLEDDGEFVTMYSDFRKGKTSAVIYKEDGKITPVSGSIKLKKDLKNSKAVYYHDDLDLEELLK